MTTYRYKGLTLHGTAVEGVVEAATAEAALTEARKNCRVVLAVEPVKPHGFAFLHTDITELLAGGKITDKTLSLLCSQLAIELKAGLPLLQSLRLVAENETHKPLRRILKQAAEDVQAGHGLADSLSLYSGQLPRTFVETVRAGESGGHLDDVFERLSAYYANNAAVGSKITSALAYPVLLLLAAVVVIGVIIVKAVPVFTQAFVGQKLPLPTRILIGISGFLSANWPVLLAILGMAALAFHLWGRTSAGAALRYKLPLVLPGLGKITLMGAAVHFCNTMETLLASGLPLVQSMEITANATENLLISRDIDAARRAVLEGRTMCDSLRKGGHFPALLLEMLAVGERTGNLEETLVIVSRYYTQETDVAVQRFLSLLEPCIIIVLALVVVFILLSVYLPLFSMYGGL